MGEVESVESRRRPSEKLQDSWLARWLFPQHVEELRALEGELFEHTQQLTLRLQKVQSQNRQLLDEDIGQYKNRWVNLASGDYNPDTITFTEYKKMASYDAQVLAGWDLIQMGVLMKPWRVRHKDEEITKALTQAFNNLRYPSFRDAMKQMMSAIIYGFSVTEIVFDEYGGNWFPRRNNGLKTFDPETVRFFSDEFGNLQSIQQYSFISQRARGTIPTGAMSWGTGIPLPLDRTLIWSHEKHFGNWYGTPLLQGCYKNWYIKDAMLKFANIAYERFGSPILMGIAANIKDMGTISEAIEHLYARSQAVIVKRDEKDPTGIEVLESRRKEMPFDRYIRYHDEMLLRRMLIGQRIFEGGGGVYGPKVPLDIIFMRFEDFRLELIDVVNDLIRTIVDLNWDVKGEYPRLEFAPLTTMDQQQLRQSIYDAIDRGVIDREEPWVRDELGFPEHQTPTKKVPPPAKGPGLPPAAGPREPTEGEELDTLIAQKFQEWRAQKQEELRQMGLDEGDEEEDW
jgi:hypothetical protein